MEKEFHSLGTFRIVLLSTNILLIHIFAVFGIAPPHLTGKEVWLIQQRDGRGRREGNSIFA